MCRLVYETSSSASRAGDYGKVRLAEEPHRSTHFLGALHIFSIANPILLIDSFPCPVAVGAPNFPSSTPCHGPLLQKEGGRL